MIGVDEILDILKVTVYSGAVEGENPLSVGIIASVGTGKTSMVKKTASKTTIKQVSVPGKDKEKSKLVEVRKIDGSVLYTTNCTPYALYTRYGHDLKSGHIKHIVIPDFLSILNLPKYQMMTVVSFYNSLIEEGIMSIESRDGHFLSQVPITIGLITTIARQDFIKRKDEWAAIGFLSRLLPVSFRYKESTAKDIREAVKIKEYLVGSDNFNITLPSETEIDLPLKEADIIEAIAIATKDPNDELGVRRQKQLQVFAMSNALMNGRDTVNSEDTDKLTEYKKYFNYDCKQEI
jgi:hypothetical protein